MASAETSSRRLEVSARAVARFWEVAPDTVRRAGMAGLLPTAGEGFDAARVLALASRPYVDPEDLDRLPPGSVLLVQQSGRREVTSDEDDFSWRKAYGWDSGMDEQEALLSACGWWPVRADRQQDVLAVVSVMSSFVVTVGMVDRTRPVEARALNKVRFNLLPADRDDPTAALVLSVFEGRRMRPRTGSSFLVP